MNKKNAATQKNMVKEDRSKKLELLTCLLFLSRISQQSTKFKFDYMTAEETTSLTCPNAADLTFYKILYDNSVNPTLLIKTTNVVTPPLPTGAQGFVTISTGPPVITKYALYDHGSNCYTFANPTTDNRVVVLIFVLIKTGTNSCKVEKFLTNAGLMPSACNAGNDIMAAFQFTGGGASHLDFKSIKYSVPRKFKYSKPLLMRAFGMTLNQIDSRVVEMMLLEPFVEAHVGDTVMLYNRAINNDITENYNDNSPAQPIKTRNYIDRVIKDTLPGYFLGRAQSTDPVQTEGALQFIHDWGDLQQSRSVHILTYFSNPDQFVHNEVHKMVVASQGFKHNPSQANTLFGLALEVVFKRVTNDIEFEIKSAGQSVFTATLTGPDFNKYLYMGFTAGQGILFYTSETQVVTQIVFTISFYQSGGLKQYFHQSVPMAPANINTIFKTDTPADQTHVRWTSVSYQNPKGNDHNKIGIRVFQLVYGVGAYPFHLIASNTLDAQYERCFWQAYQDNKCIGMALLADSSEAQVTVLHLFSSSLKTVTDPNMLAGCRVPYNEKNCLTPKSGYIVNLDPSQTSSIQNNLISAVGYSNLRQDQKNFFAEYLVDPGNPNSQKYLLSCPFDCKLFCLNSFRQYL